MSDWELTRRSLRRIEEGRPDIPLVCAPAPPAEAWQAQAGQDLDDTTFAYVLAARPAFDLLRQASGQLAALLVLAAAGGRSARDNPAFALACSARAEAADMLGSSRPSRQGAHHHRHLLACAEALSAACEAASLTVQKGQDETALTLLQESLRQLHFAAAALPGFEVVAFGQACCAMHTVAKDALEQNARR